MTPRISFQKLLLFIILLLWRHLSSAKFLLETLGKRKEKKKKEREKVAKRTTQATSENRVQGMF